MAKGQSSFAPEEIGQKMVEEVQAAVVAVADPSAGKIFSVAYGDHRMTIPARDESEAWAIFCDTIKCWPGGKVTRSINEVK